MSDPKPYISFPGNARQALGFYADVFGGDLQLNTNADFSNDAGPGDAIAHGVLSGGLVTLYGSDTSPGENPVRVEGLLFSLLGTAEPDVLHRWFDRLADGGAIVDPLAPKPWGASDGQVIDRYGIAWLIGYEADAS